MYIQPPPIIQEAFETQDLLMDIWYYSPSESTYWTRSVKALTQYCNGNVLSSVFLGEFAMH